MTNPLHKPTWFSDDYVLVSNAKTCGLSRGGRPLFQVDPETGSRIQEVDSDTDEKIDAIDDRLAIDVQRLTNAEASPTLIRVPRSNFKADIAVPNYYDKSSISAFEAFLESAENANLSSLTIGQAVEKKLVTTRGGHGSPSAAERTGEIPYIKVSDLRAGLVNINPTNRVPAGVANRFWKGGASGLRAFDLLCPERTSKNIGDFCVLLPGQEQVVLTKEIIVLRPGEKAYFDPFYLLWAMTLKVVRDQWERVVFMQTNREDVGKRFLEIQIPIPNSEEDAMELSGAFRQYYKSLAIARSELSQHLTSGRKHHFFVTGAE